MMNDTYNGSRYDGEDDYGMSTTTVELYVVMGILSFLSVIGVAGNALVLYVFAKKKDRMTSTLFILGLAFVDFTTCLIVMPYTIYMEYVNFNISYDLLCKIYQFLITSNIPFSALIMVAIAIDRYFCICHPFLHAMTIPRAKIMITCLALFAAGLGIIVALMYGVFKIPEHPLMHKLPRNISDEKLLSGTPVPYDTVDDDGTVASYLDGVRNHTSVQNDIYHSMNHRPPIIPVFTGQCQPNNIYLSSTFQWYYQKFYTAMFLVSLIIVIVLYISIYKSVLTRRTKRAKQKSKSLPLVVSSAPDHDINGQEETLLTTVNGESNDIRNGSSTAKASSTVVFSSEGTTLDTTTTTIVEKPSKKEKKEKDRRKSTKKDRTRVANLKTAIMLFVVTVVFIVTFLPAFLMALQILPYDIIIFYMYFANNVANPVIYSFMNKNFRDDLKKLFCRG